MQVRRGVTGAVAVSLVGLAVGGPQAAVAAETAGVKVVLNKQSVAVSSLNTVPVEVTVEGSYPDLDFDNKLFVQFKRIGGSGPANEVSSTGLTLTDGDGTPGVWKGVAYIPSTLNGTVEPAAVSADEFVAGEPPYSPQPVTDPPVLVVNGVHVPKLTSLVTPKVVPYNKPWTVRYSVIDSQTGKPYGTKLKLWYGVEERCLENNERAEVLTDTNGNLTRAFAANPYGDWTTCVKLPGNPGGIARLKTPVKRMPVLSATPSKTSAPVGTIVPVNGTVYHGASYCQIQLQRLYGATAWRTVGTTAVRTSDRYTLNAQPSYKGNISYRVYFPACHDKVAASTKPFVIRGL